MAAKRKLWKEWKNGGSKERYLVAKRKAEKVIFHAKKRAEEPELVDINTNKDIIYRIVKQLRREHQDEMGEKRVKNVRVTIWEGCLWMMTPRKPPGSNTMNDC